MRWFHILGAAIFVCLLGLCLDMGSASSAKAEPVSHTEYLLNELIQEERKQTKVMERQTIAWEALARKHGKKAKK